MRHLATSDYPVSRWSGGTTAEILILPEGSRYADRNFDLRLSTATLETDEPTPFTGLPGYDRILVALSELRLEVEGEERNLRPGESLSFRGEERVSSLSKGVDFNLMTRRGFQAGLRWGRGEVQGPSAVFDPADRSTTILEAGESAAFSRDVLCLDLR
jgi:environmental stress-induced protein Ves